MKIDPLLPESPVEVFKALTSGPNPTEVLVALLHANDGYIGGTIRMGSSDWGSDYAESGVARSEETPQERFSFGTLLFDIDAAKEMSDGKANDSVLVDPNWSYKINVDRVAAMQSKSVNPVIIAQLALEGNLVPLLIDGHHRMYKAIQEGKEYLPAFVLSPEQTLFIMDASPDVKTTLTKNLRDIEENGVIHKTQPTASGVHVPAPMGNTKRKAKRKTAKDSEESNAQPGQPPGLATTPAPELPQKPGWQYPPENNDDVPVMSAEKKFAKKAKAVKALDLDIAGALAEVSQMDDAEIENETALKWTARAIAVFILADQSEDDDEKHDLVDWGDELFHEALEHAALVKDDGKTVAQVQQAVEEQRQKVVEKSAALLASTTIAAVRKSLGIPSGTAPIFKLGKKQIVYGVVLEPGTVDLQGDIMSEEDIEETAHDYLENERNVGKRHQGHIQQAAPVESYIAPTDIHFEDGPYGPTTIKKGSWVLGVKVRDPYEWEKCERGEYSAFSVGGTGVRQSV